MSLSEEKPILIVGAGICGLATALGLHRVCNLRMVCSSTLSAAGDMGTAKWPAITMVVATVSSYYIPQIHQPPMADPIETKDQWVDNDSQEYLRKMKGLSSIVVERWESLRATGSAIAIYANGWRALDQLGVGQVLRSKAVPLQAVRDGSSQVEAVTYMNEEFRCLKRSDLINTLADNLPPGTIRFGCQILGLNLDLQTAYPIVHLHDGTSIQAKVVIGCDGINSVVADWLGLKTARQFSRSVVRGFTNYPHGHGFSNEFFRVRRSDTAFGRIPVDDKLVYWYVARPSTPEDSMLSKQPKLIRDSTVESLKNDFAADTIEMMRNSDLESLTLLSTSYRAPWDLLLGNFSTGTVTVAGDAMHVMGPFIGQGGSAGLEDAVVLARCLAKEMSMAGHTPTKSSELEGKMIRKRIGKAFDQYVKERRMRILGLSTQTYLIGMLLQASLPAMKLMILMLLKIFFPNSYGHTRHDCGRL